MNAGIIRISFEALGEMLHLGPNTEVHSIQIDLLTEELDVIVVGDDLPKCEEGAMPLVVARLHQRDLKPYKPFPKSE